MLLNERILKVILALAEELHFGKASEKLHLSQPALSGTVKTLERDLGVRLFIRTTRNVQITDAGQTLVAEGRRLLEQSDRAITLVRARAPDVITPFRIACSSSVDPRWTAALVRATQRANISAGQFQFASAQASGLRAGLIKGSMQAALFIGTLPDPDLESVALFQEEFAVAVGPRHKWARASSVRIEQLTGEPAIRLRRDADPLLFDAMTTRLASEGYQPRVSHEVSTYFECLQFAGEGLGITLVPMFMESRVRAGSAVFLPISPHGLRFDCMLSYLQSSVPPAWLECLLRVVLARAAPEVQSTGMRILPR
jgi:DNA-binding transcriptional LysR family regulator